MRNNRTPLLLQFLIIAIILTTNGCSSKGFPKKCEPTLTKIEKKSGPVLLVVAHQDDDAFIVSRLRQHIRLGDDVHIVWTAVSNFRTRLYKFIRIREAKTAMQMLGVNPDNYHFLEYPDGETHNYVGEIISRLKELLLKIKPKTVYVHAYEGGNIDHDVSHFCVVRAMEEIEYSAQVYEFPLYNAYRTFILIPFTMRKLIPGVPTKCRKLLDEEFSFAKEYWSIYESQHFPLGFFIDFFKGKKRVFGIEYLRELPKYNYLEKPAKGRVAYHRYQKARFEDFKKAVIKHSKINH